MWVHVEVRCGGGFRWEQGIPRCTQIHTSLIVNQAYACATTNSTGYVTMPTSMCELEVGIAAIKILLKKAALL
jgi:hypothetical protein